MAYTVSTPVFEGPFDLLLHLITREEVDIYDVPLAGIVDAYLVEIDRLEGLDLETATQFLLIAATLVELKARRLLPGRSDFELDDELLYEERDLLLARLLECKTFKDAARTLDELRRRASRSVPRTAGPEEPFASMVPDPLEQAGLDRFVAAARRAFSPREEVRVSFDHVAPIRITVRDAIDDVLAAIPRQGSVTFRRLNAGVADRVEIVVRFLAVLELYKRGVVEIDQPTVFGELTLRLTDDDAAEHVDLGGLEEWDEIAGEPAGSDPGAHPADDQAAGDGEGAARRDVILEGEVIDVSD